MKNLKRAYRRHKHEVKLKRKAKKYYAKSVFYSLSEAKNWATFWKELKSGSKYGWLRSFSCSCELCTAKYERPSKGEVGNIIQDELLD